MSLQKLKLEPVKEKCKVCDCETTVVFNINFKATPICESCATSIFLQQAQWYTQQQKLTKCKG